MVEWLREVGMPADYVNKLARMFQDIKVSEDLNAQFRASTSRHDAINIKVSTSSIGLHAARIKTHTIIIIAIDLSH